MPKGQVGNGRNVKQKRLKKGSNLQVSSYNEPRRRGPKGTSSQHRGVTQHRRTKKWESHIWDNRQQMYLGGYPSEQGAARAHDIMALKCRGTDSITNYDKDDYAGLANELETRSKDEIRALLLCKDTIFSSLTLLASPQQDVHEDSTLRGPSFDSTLEEAATPSRDMRRTVNRAQARRDNHVQSASIPLQGNNPGDEADEPSDGCNDSSASDVCSLTSPRFQAETQLMAGNRSVTHALPPILLCPHLNDISSPLSVNELHSCFSPQHSSDQLFPRGYNKDSASLRDQNMFGMNGSVHQPDHVCALGDRGLDSMQAGTGFTLEPHLSNRSAQLYQDHWSPRMPAADPCSIGSASFSTAASRRYQSGPAVAYPESRSRYTASIASPTISSSRLGSLYGHADTEALTSTWQGQPLETRCTSTGHTSYARPTLSGMRMGEQAAEYSQGRLQEAGRSIGLATYSDDQACRSPLQSHLYTARAAVPETGSYADRPGSRLHSPRQALFMSSFNTAEHNSLPPDLPPPWRGSIHRPTFNSPAHSHGLRDADPCSPPAHATALSAAHFGW